MNQKTILSILLAVIAFSIMLSGTAFAATPTADFAANTTSGTFPLIVDFTDLSTNSPTSWTWYFGDENLSASSWNEINSSAWLERFGHTSVVLPDGIIIVMGGYGGGTRLSDVWRSTDNGTTWNLMNTSAWPARSYHSSVALSDGSILVMGGKDVDGTNLNDVWKSVDNGATWTQLTTSGTMWSARNKHSSVVLSDDTILLMGGYDLNFKNDIYKSTDGGTTWSKITDSAIWSTRECQQTVVLPDDSIVLMGGNRGSLLNDVYRSIDKGVTWEQVSSSAEWSARQYHSSVALPDGTIVLMAGNDGSYLNDVWTSTDNGTTWEEVSSSAEWSARQYPSSVLLSDGTIVLMGGNNASRLNDVWSLSTAGSTEQNPVHTYNEAGTYNVTLKVSNSDGSNITTFADLISVTIGAPVADFTSNVTSGEAPFSVDFTDLSLNGPTGWAWYFGEDNLSDSSWTEVNSNANWTGRSGHSIVTLPDGSILLTGGATALSTSKNDTWRSTDNGVTWTLINSSSGWSERRWHDSVALSDGSIVLFGGYDSNTNFLNDTWRSTDNGLTWTEMNSSSGWLTRKQPSSVVLSDDSILLMGGYTFTDGTSFNDTWISEDFGATWTEVNSNANWSARSEHTSVALPDDSIVLMGGIDSNNNFLNDTWRSEDKGITWTELNSSSGWSGRFYHSSVALPDSSIVLMGGKDSNGYFNDTWHSNDKGATWTEINSTGDWIGRRYLNTIALNDGSIMFMGGDDGGSNYFNDVWKLTTASSTEQNPTHAYDGIGTYQVTLQAYNSKGYNSIIQNIEVAKTPVANFTANVTSGITPLSVNFTDLSTNEPTSWEWDFGNGDISTEQNPVYTYSEAGTYTVNLTATNAGGNNTTTISDYIIVTDIPVSNFTANVTSGSVPLTVNFTDISENDPTSWEWDFGDGNNATGQNQIYTYTTAGTYNVSLNASNIAGSNTKTLIGYITVAVEPVSNFTANVTSGTNPLSVAFTDQSENEPTSWEWNFGDGSTSTEQNPIHTYAAAGTYNVSLNASNVGGSNNKTVNTYITVADTPVANFTSNVTSGANPLSVAFTDLSENVPTSWEWNFGDGSTSTEQNPIHTYSEVGTYNVSLNASNIGGSNNKTINSYITVANIPVPDFTSNVTSGALPLTVSFSDQSTNGPTEWEWNFGDGNTSTEQNPTHTYSTVGAYNVSLNASNVGGNNNISVTDYITVAVAPVANFTTDITSGTTPLTVTFTDLSTNGPTTWEWDFGDGTTATSQNPTHTYSAAGTYTVSLNASNVGGSNVTTMTGYIIVNAPVEDSGSSSDSSSRRSIPVSQPSEIVASTHSSMQHILGGSSIEYDLSQTESPVVSIKFDAKDNEGLVVASVQVLSDSPDNTPSPVGDSYQLLSIDVGKQGTISSQNAENILINFRVSREWIQENNLDPATIRMARYHEGEWEKLPTDRVNEDDEFLYFVAETQGFSIFSVIGDEVKATTEEEKSAIAEFAEDEPVESMPAEEKSTPGFDTVMSLVFVTVAFFVSRKIRQN